MANWSILYEPHGKFVTCQRPIVITATVTSGAVAHFKGSLEIKISNVWTDTGILMNGYNDDGGATYSFNVAEYCRNFFTESEDFYAADGWCGFMNTMAARQFRLTIYPVEYDVNGNLIPDPTDSITSRDFFAIPTNTQAIESTSSVNDNIRIDKFVLNGGNDSSAAWFGSDKNQLLTNMPDYNVCDISKGFRFYHNYLISNASNRQAVLWLTNDSNALYVLNISSNDNYEAIHVHPLLLDFLITLSSGVQTFAFTDVNGNLTSSYSKVQLKFNDINTGLFIRSSPQAIYSYKDGVGCRSKTFIFRNMRGGFDHFTSTGTQDRSVELSGSEFDRHTRFDRAKQDFDLIRGQHNVTNLWNSRKEMHTVFSQPLSKEYSIWLEELIMSPQVWLVEDIEGYQGDNNSFDFYSQGLVAVNIIKGSYKLYNTEKNTNFMEFKYTLSENTITQKM